MQKIYYYKYYNITNVRWCIVLQYIHVLHIVFPTSTTANEGCKFVVEGGGVIWYIETKPVLKKKLYSLKSTLYCGD